MKRDDAMPNVLAGMMACLAFIATVAAELWVILAGAAAYEMSGHWACPPITIAIGGAILWGGCRIASMIDALRD
jgi:hypothetical protein